jgi:oxalate decarboxylase
MPIESWSSVTRVARSFLNPNRLNDLVFLEMFRTSEYQDVSLAEWMAHTPHLLMDQHLGVGMSVRDNISKDEVVIRPV